MENHLLPIIHFTEEVMSRGEGSYVYDTEGKKYLDLNSGQFCVALGHSNEEIMEKIFDKARKIVHTASNIYTDEVAECSNKLNELSGDMDAYSILLSTGSEAVEFCMRFSKFLKGREGVVCFDRGYHGLTLGSQTITFGGKFAKPHIDKIATVNVPVTEEEAEESAEALRKLLETGEYASVVVEPIVSVGGMLYPPQKWFDLLRKVCDDNDTLLIFDESQTGFGRTGEWFAYQEFHTVPDMVVLAKSVGLGFPVSVAMFRKELVPDETYRMSHYSSHQNDSFAASIINTAIDYIEKNDVLAGIRVKGDYFLKKLQELEQKNEHIRDARGHGLMLGCELYYDGVEDYRPLYGKLYDRMMKNGVIIQGTNGGHTLRFLPDYLLDEKDIDFACDTLDRVLNELQGE
ncbi:MAG: aspartate aminotransferase family protein [Mogibacterium sp.]|nr:aspartate aminotransferase family protein [Mogibacterium sp.]